MITVLVTTVGSGIGQSVIDSLNLQKEYKIIGCNRDRNVYAHSYCHKFYKVNSFLSKGYLNEIIDLCVENKVDIVIPGHDKELTLFAENLHVFKAKGIEVLVSEPTVTEISRDKQEWYNFFASKGCKIVPTISLNEFKENIDTSIFPAIVKPSGGSASQGISIINTVEGLEGLKGEDIIQPYLFPEKEDPNYEDIKKAVLNGDFIQKSEISVQLLFDRKSKHTATFISKNILKNGVPVFVDPIDPEGFKYISEVLKFVPILEEKKVKGPVNIQGRITPNGLYFFEMNMRFTGITGNRALLGFNEVDYLVRNFLGKPASIEGYALNKLGVRQVACATISKEKNLVGKKILTILGGGSSVGSYFLNTLNFDDFAKIYLIARARSVDKYVKKFIHPVFEVVSEADNKIATCFTQSDVLINFVSALAYEEEVLKYDAVRYIYNMIPKIAKAKVPLLINISSQSVYDQQENSAKTEQANLEVKTSYAFQKLIIEDFILSVKEYSIYSKAISLRLPRILNTENTKELGFFGNIITNYISGKETIINHPKNNTNLIHIKDVCSAIDFVINTIIDEPILNVSGQNVSMEEYCNEIKKQLPNYKESRIIFGDNLIVKNSSMVNGDKFKNLGWKSGYNIKSIISEIIANNV